MAMKDDVEHQIEALQGLIRSPGWKFLEGHIERRASQMMSEMRNAPNQDALLKSTYTYIALKDVLTAPEVMLKPLVMTLQTLTKK